MTLDYAARQVIYAIVKKKRVWVFDERWDAIVNVWRLIPDNLWVRLKVPVSYPDIPLPWPLSRLNLLKSDTRNAHKSDDPEGMLPENAILENYQIP